LEPHRFLGKGNGNAAPKHRLIATSAFKKHFQLRYHLSQNGLELNICLVIASALL
jgi:hypothetical protein